MFPYIYRVVHISSESGSGIFLLAHKEASSSLLLPQPPGTATRLSVSIRLPFLDISYRWSHNMWSGTPFPRFNSQVLKTSAYDLASSLPHVFSLQTHSSLSSVKGLVKVDLVFLETAAPC